MSACPWLGFIKVFLSSSEQKILDDIHIHILHIEYHIEVEDAGLVKVKALASR